MSEKAMSHAASQPLDIPDSPVGYHCLHVPAWVSNPPIEAVVFGWGASEDHQLGLDSEEDIDSPKVVESLLGIKFMGRSFYGCPLVGGSRNTLAIDSDGGLWSWGWNARGTLGHGHRDLLRKPAGVAALAGVRIVQAAIGGWHCLALSDEGQVYCWGGNEYQQCGLVAPDEQPQPGSQAAAAAAAEQDAAGQGSNMTDGLLAAAAAAVAKAAGLNGHAANGAAGSGNSQAAGSRAAAGEDRSYGVLPAVRDILVPLRCMPGLVVRQVACGGMNSVVLTEGGEVWTWGEPWGEFALELQLAPRKVPGAVNIAAIACGAFHNMALVADGRVLTWGTNDYGQLGNGSTIYSTTPVEVVDLEDVAIADIAAGGWHSMALTADGQIYVWGRGEYGRLGIADRTGSSKLRPHKVRGLEGHTVVQVAAGGTHSLAVTSSGRMFIWGRASYGRLGLGPGGKDQYAPVEAQLPGGHERWKVAAATAGGRHTMCLAVPVRDASLRSRGTDSNSRAASVTGNSRGPSRTASVQGEQPASVTQQQPLQQQQQQGRVTGGSTPGGYSGAAVFVTDGTRTPASEADGHNQPAYQQQQQLGGVLRGPSPLSRNGSAAGAPSPGSSNTAGGSTATAASQQQHNPSGSAAGTAGGSSGGAGQGSGAGGALCPGPYQPGAPLPALGHALSNASSHSFAPSPGSSVLGGSPHRSGAGDNQLVFSPVQRGGAGHQGSPQAMGVDAIHAATAAAAAAAHLGAVRVGSPVPGSSSGGGNLVSLDKQWWGGSGTDSGDAATGLRPGEQMPVSPRSIPPPMSPSQRRAKFGLGSLLNSEPGLTAQEAAFMPAAGREAVELQHQLVRQQLLQDEQAAEDDAAQQEEEQEQRELEEMDREEEVMQQQRNSLQQQWQQQQQQHPPPSRASGGNAAGSEQQQQQQQSETTAVPAASSSQVQPSPGQGPGLQQPGSSGPSLAAAAEAAGIMKRSGSYQGLSSLPPRPLQPSSSPRGEAAALGPQHVPGAGILHTLSAGGAGSVGGASANTGTSPSGSSTGGMAPLGQMSRQQSAQLAAAVASSHVRVDASRMASAASLPSLSAGVGLGPSSRMGPAVLRVDSDISQEGLSGLSGDEANEGASPTGSNSRGGASPTGSHGSGSGMDMLGTSPPGGVYDVSLGEAMARYTNSLPEREFIHYNTHLS